MKARNYFKILPLIVFVALTLVYTSCKKSDTSVTDNTVTQFPTTSDDATRVNNETDDVANDANTAIEANPSISGGRIEGGRLICDADSIIADSVQHSITIYYDGTLCDGLRTRTGTVTIQLTSPNNKWTTQNAYITITIDLTIKRILDGSVITIQGTKTITNESGGLLKNLVSGSGSVAHNITSSGLSITFSNGTQRTWQISKHRVFTNSGGIITITTTGTGNSNGEAIWGTDRYGNNFSYDISQPMVYQIGCGLSGGQAVFTGLQRTLTITYGLNATGGAGSCPGPFYYEATWTDLSGKSHTIFGIY